jgi:hypothetical protein
MARPGPDASKPLQAIVELSGWGTVRRVPLPNGFERHISQEHWEDFRRKASKVTRSQQPRRLCLCIISLLCFLMPFLVVFTMLISTNILPCVHRELQDSSLSWLMMPMTEYSCTHLTHHPPSSLIPPPPLPPPPTPAAPPAPPFDFENSGQPGLIVACLLASILLCSIPCLVARCLDGAAHRAERAALERICADFSERHAPLVFEVVRASPRYTCPWALCNVSCRLDTVGATHCGAHNHHPGFINSLAVSLPSPGTQCESGAASIEMAGFLPSQAPPVRCGGARGGATVPFAISCTPFSLTTGGRIGPTAARSSVVPLRLCSMGRSNK